MKTHWIIETQKEEFFADSLKKAKQELIEAYLEHQDPLLLSDIYIENESGDRASVGKDAMERAQVNLEELIEEARQNRESDYRHIQQERFA